MSRSWTFPRPVLAAMLFAAVGCRAASPLPMPDAARGSGVRLRADATSLVIRPGSSGRLRFQVRDDGGLPLPDYPVAFAIDGQQPAGPTASLSVQQSLTDNDGDAVLEIMVGPLASHDRPASFWVVATSPGAPSAQVQILVTTNAYAVEILPIPADDLVASGPVTATRLYFYDGAACADLDVYDANASVGQARPPNLVPLGSTAVYPGVAASGVHAVIGLGLDGTQTTQVGGCVDVPGAALLESETMRVVLLMDHPFPTIAGTYQVLSDFRLDQAPAALSGVRSAWQQWTRCPLDPARLWLDCTIATFDPNAKPCGAIGPGVGGVAERLLEARGQIVPPLAGTVAASTDLPCHGTADANGNLSLESVVDALFTRERITLANHSLATLPTELARLLGDVRVDSQLLLAPAYQSTTYWVDHRLLAVSFPDALSPAFFPVAKLGLPSPQVSGILSLYKSGQLGVPDHGFTLRLGSTARLAFEASSLAARRVQDVAALVERVFSMAQLGDQPGAPAGCVALDAAACDLVKLPRGCLGNACWDGLANLTRNLTAAFDSLDGVGLDFHLYGSAPVIDLEGNGRADALQPGLWTATFDTVPEHYVTYGSWIATRAPAPR